VVAGNDPTVSIAVGDPGKGLDGFRVSHLHAVGAQTVAMAADPGRPLTTFAGVGPLTMMCHDMAAPQMGP
jgi:hypothetical protein